jgi:periplasmic divalent cation tolerance protein
VQNVVVYITAKDREQAKSLGLALVSKQLAACVNIIDGMQSIYWWEGKLEEASEAILIAKTTEAALPSLTALVKALHSYSCPCVVSYAITGGNPDYLAWITENVKPAPSDR